jgi:hypothetical protein
VFVQITLFNDTASENHQTIYMKWLQAKVVWGISRREGERDRESGFKERETEHRRGSETACVGSDRWGGHLRIWG